MNRFTSFVLTLFLNVSLGTVAFAQAEFRRGEVLVIHSQTTYLYAGPDESQKTNSVIQAGRRVKAAGGGERGFVPLVTKSGRAWVRESDVRAEVATAADLVEPSRAPVKQTEFPFGIERMTFDLGGSLGSYGDLSYTEINLGVNTYFSEYFAWRNAVFARFMEKTDNIFGLDTSLRGIYNAGDGGAGVTVFAGPGYRFANRGPSAPLLEGGLVLHLAGLSIGGGVKTILASVVDSGAKNDTQYFIILAGGGSF